MRRALQTALLSGFEDLQVTPLLKEVDYGRFEGLTSREIRAEEPAWELYKDGCPGGETPAEIYARSGAFIEEVTQRGNEGNEGRAIVFSHGHILRAIGVAWIGADITVASGLQLDVATLSVLRDGDHGRVVALWNSA